MDVCFLGGANEIGPNSCSVKMGNTTVLIDVGMHPRRRTIEGLPAITALKNSELDAIILTHAHLDHCGALPYVFKHYPTRRIISTYATRDIVSIVLRDSVKIMKKRPFTVKNHDDLSLFTNDFVSFVSMIHEGHSLQTPFTISNSAATDQITATLHFSGHVLGAAGVMLEHSGVSLFHTGDCNFTKQFLLPPAQYPRHHVDVLICEGTNGSIENLPTYDDETKKLIAFINQITTHNGSVLLPSFSLGRTQEILTLLYTLMRRGSIPSLPIYSAGMAKKISRLYDVYTYTTPRNQPGFEIADIPQSPLEYDKLLQGPYMKTPSIVVASSGMMEKGTTSYQLAVEWMRRPEFGICFVGYIDPDSIGNALALSENKKPFMFGDKLHTRFCHVERCRFSAHAHREDIVEFITDIRPKHCFLVHGDDDALSEIGKLVKERVPTMKVYIPTVEKKYQL